MLVIEKKFGLELDSIYGLGFFFILEKFLFRLALVNGEMYIMRILN